MICPKCHAETPAEALQCPACNLPTPRGNQLKRGRNRGASLSGRGKRSRARDGKTRWRSRLKRPAAIILSIVIITAFGLGCYLAVFSYLDSKRVAADVALGEMNKLRNLPSRQEGLSVEQFLDQEFKKYKDAGYLLRYQGWRTKIIKGTDTNFLVIFSFEDTDNVEHRAEWLVDVRNSAYTPQTDLAITAYKN